MNIEKFGERIVRKEDLRISAKVEHAPQAVSPEQPDFSFSEKIIKASDRGSQEELVSSLDMMLNRINFPTSALEAEIGDDEEKIDRVNVLVNEYLGAVKALDTKKQGETSKSLERLLG